MRRPILCRHAALFCTAGLLLATAARAKQPKVDICHVTGSGQILRINVAAPSVPAHQAHGDFLPLVFFADNDGDGFGSGPAFDGCVIPPGFVDNDLDCNDADPTINPAATEVCDFIDNDCDSAVDEGFDLDGDGFTTCGGDCDDADPAVNPGAAEVCNFIDDDCDGAVDEGFDLDADGFTSCGGDCDDSDPTVNPGAVEVCNFVDDDCDGAVDEDFDLDGDGFTTCGGDCDDADPAVNPGAAEACNSVDDDCDGAVDEGFDLDADSFTTCGGDCDDADPAVNPGASEVCNGVDDDCDGATDEGSVCGALRVFVSSMLFDGNFGAGFGGDGLAGADASCQVLADNAGLSGTFRAWLSGRPDGEVGGGGQDVLDRFTQSSGPYELVDGTVVADSFADLTDGSLDHAIDLTELNTPVGTENRVWTNTRTDGNAFSILRDCALNAGPDTWTCTPGSVCPFESGNYGDANSATSTWTTAVMNNTNCAEMLHIYCFEQ